MSPMLEDMQDILFSATRRKRVWEESKSILLLTGGDAGEVGQRRPRVSHHRGPTVIYLSRHRNWPKVSSKGTRNLVLSNRGRVFSRKYRSTITWGQNRTSTLVIEETSGFTLTTRSDNSQAACWEISSEWCTLHLSLFLESCTFAQHKSMQTPKSVR